MYNIFTDKNYLKNGYIKKLNIRKFLIIHLKNIRFCELHNYCFTYTYNIFHVIFINF